MKIGIARRTYRSDGGAEKSVDIYLKAILELGFDAELATSSWLDTTTVDVETYHIPIHGWSRVSKSRSFRRGVERWAETGSCHVYQANEWASGVDILRLGDGLHSIWLKILAEANTGISKYFRVYSQFHRDRIKSERDALLHPRLKKVICNSRYVCEQLNHFYPEIKHKAVVIHNPISSPVCEDLASEHINLSERYRLGFVGSGWYRKGLDRAIEALVRMPSEFILEVAGRDSSESKYVAMARELGVLDRICFRGTVTDMCTFYKNIDLLIHPARYDPFPNVAIEALAAGIPVLSSSECGLVDLADYTGVYIFDSRASNLSQHVLEIAGGRSQLLSRKIFKDFSYDSFRNKISECYRELV